jgi:hypothetical protein
MIPASLWLEAPLAKALFWTSEFPKNWQKLLLVKSPFRDFWNADHPLVELMNEHPDAINALDKLPSRPLRYTDPVELETRLQECLTSKILAAHFVVSQLLDSQSLPIMRDSFPGAFAKLLKLLDVERFPLFWWEYGAIYAKTSETFMLTFDNFKKRSEAPSEDRLILPDETELEISEDNILILRERQASV